MHDGNAVGEVEGAVVEGQALAQGVNCFEPGIARSHVLEHDGKGVRPCDIVSLVEKTFGKDAGATSDIEDFAAGGNMLANKCRSLVDVVLHDMVRETVVIGIGHSVEISLPMVPGYFRLRGV